MCANTGDGSGQFCYSPKNYVFHFADTKLYLIIEE